MPGVILAVVERPETADRILAAARILAGLTSAARINVLAIRTPPIATIQPTEQIMTPEYAAQVRSREQARVDAMRAMFEAWKPAADAGGIVTGWSDIEALAEVAVAEWGGRADFVVLARSWHGAPLPGRQAINGVLFDTDRPVLVVPPNAAPAPFGQRVAIAWREDNRTIRAVLSALRWLSRAERVFVLAGAREGAPPVRLPEVFVEHGVDAELHILPISSTRMFGEALLARAHELGADMLVMGAYVHQRMAGLILGGVTRHMLAHADIPVLMRH
jgi:nucleotide-binding universal stress UspA family protein